MSAPANIINVPKNAGISTRGGGHSGPGGCRINLSKCTKNAAKCGNVTLTIAYHENEINLYGSFKKNDFQSKNIFDLVNGDFGQSGP